MKIQKNNHSSKEQSNAEVINQKVVPSKDKTAPLNTEPEDNSKSLVKVETSGSFQEKILKEDSKYWLIPKEIYEPLDKEFKFDFDPCPYPYKRDGIEIPWGKVNWVNPPFRAKDSMNGHGPTSFVRKAIEEQKKGKTSVIILPVLSMLNMLFEAGAEVRSCGRVRWIHAETGEKWKSPSNCALFILRGNKEKAISLTKKEILKIIDERIKHFKECLERTEERKGALYDYYGTKKGYEDKIKEFEQLKKQIEEEKK